MCIRDRPGPVDAAICTDHARLGSLNRAGTKRLWHPFDAAHQGCSDLQEDRQPARSPTAVSYTHLDVYKRQVTELSRWGRSTQDLLDTLHRLAGWKVSVVAMSGMTFELDTPHGRMMATLLAGISQFERDLLSERVKSGLAAARARGKKLGRQPVSYTHLDVYKRQA